MIPFYSCWRRFTYLDLFLIAYWIWIMKHIFFSLFEMILLVGFRQFSQTHQMNHKVSYSQWKFGGICTVWSTASNTLVHFAFSFYFFFQLKIHQEWFLLCFLALYIILKTKAFIKRRVSNLFRVFCGLRWERMSNHTIKLQSVTLLEISKNEIQVY